MTVFDLQVPCETSGRFEREGMVRKSSAGSLCPRIACAVHKLNPLRPIGLSGFHTGKGIGVCRVPLAVGNKAERQKW